MWWKIVLFGLVVLATLAVVGLRAFFRSLLDPCSDETCRGRLKYRGERTVSGQTVAVYSCDRCPEEVLIGLTDEASAV